MAACKDIFISYRRDTGAELAEIIKKDLGARGYSVFKDTHDLKAGHWQEDLSRQINGCKDFILLMTPGALDRCKTNPDDVVLFEIRLALAQKKNFILVVKRGKGQTPEEAFKELPSSISDLPKHNWIEYTNEDSDAKLKKIRSFLDSSPSVWELASNRYGKQLLAGVICGGLLLCGLLAWGLFGRTGRIENKVGEIAGDTKATLETTEKIQGQNQQIAKDTGEIRKNNVELVEKTSEVAKDTTAIRKDNAELMEKTREVAKDTGEIKQGIQNLGKLKGLVASPQTAADFYHNANVHRNDGNFPLAEEAFLEYFKRKTDDFYDPYELYLSILEGRNFDSAKIKERVERIAKANPLDKGAGLLLTQLLPKDQAIAELKKMISASPGYLPFYLELVKHLPKGLLIDDLAFSEVVEQFKKNGGFQGMKAFILNATNNPGSEILELAETVADIPVVDPMRRLILKVDADQFITLLWAGVADSKGGQKIIFTLPDSEIEIPLDSPDNPAMDPDSDSGPIGVKKGCFVAIEISSDGKKKGKPVYEPRQQNDVRIFPHAGSLEGVEPADRIMATVSYVDAAGRKYTFPKRVRLLGGNNGEADGESLFSLEIERNTSLVMGDFSARLTITPAQTMRSIEVSGRKEGPFKRAFPHINVPTINEVRCEEVPHLKVENGVAKVWIRGSTESGKVVEPVGISTRVPAGVRWKTLVPANAQTAAKELRFVAPEKLKYSNYYVDKMAFSPDGKFLAAQYERAGIVIWNANNGEQTAFFEAETTPELVFNNGGTAVSNGQFVVNLSDGKKEKKLDKNLDIFGMSIYPDFSRVVTVDRSKKMVIRNFPTLAVLREIELPKSRGSYRAIAISPDGKLVATSGQWVESIPIIDTATGKVVKILEDFDGSATNLCFSPDGRFLLGGGQDSKIWLWNMETGKDEAAKIQLRNKFPEGVWAGDQPLVIDQGNQSITFYNVRTGARVTDLSPPSPKFAVSPTGNYAAVVDRSGVKVFTLGVGAK